MNLPDRIVAIHQALDSARVAHAFGGAIALAYWTENPRGTSDIDVNVFVPASECEGAMRALPEGVEWGRDDLAAIVKDGQRRIWWHETPVDLFFDYHRIHKEAAAHRRYVRFAEIEIPILGPIELAVFKAMFDRTRDWADIEEMARNETLELDAVRNAISDMVGPDDSRLSRLAEAAMRGTRSS